MMSWWKWPRTNGCMVKLDFWCFTQYLGPFVWYLNAFLTPVWRGSVVNQASYQYHSLSTPTLPTMPSKCLWKCLALINDQLMISWWFGARWFGFLGSPCEGDCYLGLIPKIIRNHRAQTTSLPSVEKNLWTKSITFPTKGGHGSFETLPTESCPETLSAAEDHPWSVPKGGCIFLKASHIKQRFTHILSSYWLDGWCFVDIPNTRQSRLHVVQKRQLYFQTYGPSSLQQEITANIEDLFTCDFVSTLWQLWFDNLRYRYLCIFHSNLACARCYWCETRSSCMSQRKATNNICAARSTCKNDDEQLAYWKKQISSNIKNPWLLALHASKLPSKTLPPSVATLETSHSNLDPQISIRPSDSHGLNTQIHFTSTNGWAKESGWKTQTE